MGRSSSPASEGPEARLLLCCARTRRSDEQTVRIGALVRRGVDWELLLWTAGRHGMLPLLFWHLDAVCPGDVPGDVMARLRDSFWANNLRNLALTGELLRLLGAFEGHGIPVVPYKGPVLAASAYRNLALREFGDLDVLVRRKDVGRARELLASLGYGEERETIGGQEEAFLESQREYVFERGDVVVELHWAVMPRHFAFPLDHERVWERLRDVRLGGRAVPVFSPEDAMLILCAHGSKHLWHKLGWICDVAELVRVSEDLDWELLVKRAADLGSRRMLLLGLSLARDVLGADLPGEVSRAADADPKVRKLAGQARGWLFPDPDDRTGILEKGSPDESRFHPFRAAVRERWRDKARYCLRTAFVPAAEDWTWLRLPKRLFVLYYALRPLRLFGRYSRRTWSHLTR